MRPSFENLSSSKNTRAFLVTRITQPGFPFFWHYHPEYELTWIVSGSGKRLIGDHMEAFESGDLILIGPGMPHTWISSPTKQLQQPCEAVVIQFSDQLFTGFEHSADHASVKKMLLKSVRGLQFLPNKKLLQLIDQLPRKKGLDGIAGLLIILQQLANARSKSMASTAYVPVKGNRQEKRINRVCGYVQQHFKQEISLPQMAALVHLSVSAFCKFFKRAMGKTFSDHVNEVRLVHACRLLTETDWPISRIAAESGFASMTYFNRVFRKKQNTVPGAYRACQ